MKYKYGNEFINLEKYTPKICWDVMYMGTTDNGIDLYKHSETRSYINIDNDGNFYLYNGERYVKVDIVTAIDHELEC